MAATADPRAKHHLKPWAPPPTPREHRVSSLPAVPGGDGGARASRDRRRSSSSHRRAVTATDVAGAVEEEDHDPYEGSLEDLRAKLMGHLKDAAHRLRLPPPKSQPRSPEPEPPAAPPPPPPPPPSPPPPQDASAAASARPWNLRDRKRRYSSARGGTSSPASSPATPWVTSADKSRGGERPTFSVTLSPEEIEEDVYALTGGRPRRRPRKRPRVVQRQLDSLFPGLWLTEITADAYKVPDG